LQSALNTSQPGDTILLDGGVTYSGNFQIPAKGNANKKWIYIQSTALGKLPPAGTRVSPSDAVNMPKIVTPNATSALTFASGANYVRVTGVEIYSASTYTPPGYTPGVKYGYAIVGIGNWPFKQPIPDHIIFDRVYVHGDPTHDLQAALQVNMTNVAVVDSYISEIHMKGTDTCAVCAFFTLGPILIRNNYLEAAGENVIFGGSGQNFNPGVTSDITITGNYLYKPLSWVPLSTGMAPAYVVKNAFELKNAQRVLFDGNTIENVWAAAQAGYAVVLTVRSSQSGDFSVVNDVTITNNVIKNSVSGFNALAKDDTCGTPSYPNCQNAGSQDRWYIANNLLTFYDPTLPGGLRNVGLAFSRGIDRPNGGTLGTNRDIVFQHNTMVSTPATPCWASIYFSAGGQKYPASNVTNNVWILDNVLCRQPNGDDGLKDVAGLKMYVGDPSLPPNDVTQRYYGNVMYVPSDNKVVVFPPHNYSTTLPLVFANPAGLNYQLASPYWTDTSDGSIAGVNMTKLLVAIQKRQTAPPGGALAANGAQQGAALSPSTAPR
jgi:hypothetical protein